MHLSSSLSIGVRESISTWMVCTFLSLTTMDLTSFFSSTTEWSTFTTVDASPLHEKASIIVRFFTGQKIPESSLTKNKVFFVNRHDLTSLFISLMINYGLDRSSLNPILTNPGMSMFPFPLLQFQMVAGAAPNSRAMHPLS